MGRGRKRDEEEEEEDEEEHEEEDEGPRSKKKRTPPKKRSKSSSQAEEPVVAEAPKLNTKQTKFVYSDTHRALLQYLMVKKVVEEKTLDEISIKLGRDPKKQRLQQLIQEVNEKLMNEELFMQIRPREMVEEEGHPKVWGLVNTRNDDVSKQATSLENWQLAMFNECLQLLAKAEDGKFKHTDAIHAYMALPDAVNKSGNEVLLTLQKLIAMGWLAKTDRQNIFTAGARTLLELSEILRQYDAPECSLTKQIVIPSRAYKDWKNKAEVSKVDG